MTRRSNRRQFLRQGTLAGVGFWVAGGLARADEPKSPNERLRIAAIGVGGKGSSDLDQAAAFGDVVALCDIDDNPLNDKAKKYPQAKKFYDFRKMLDEVGKDIDAVTVSTADHTHAVACAQAIRMGKHVYCQKPLTHSVSEARVLRELAAKHKVCTQMGNQGTAEDGLRRAVEIVQAGVIGPVREIHVWTNRPVWPQAPGITARPKDTPGVPNHVRWFEFLGPAPDRPYHAAYHPFKWRGWWDFGTGALGDMACHTANMAFMACKLGSPTAIEAENGPLNPETFPAWARITFEFPARDDHPARESLPPLKFFWYEGKRDGKRVLPPEELTKGLQMSDSGSLLVGDKGILFSPNDYGSDYRLIGKDGANLEEAAKQVPQRLPRNGKGDPGMKAEWVQAIRAGKPEIALSNFGYAGLLTETILLGNVAIRAGKRIEWDGPALEVKNSSEAAQYVRREYRKGWTL